MSIKLSVVSLISFLLKIPLPAISFLFLPLLNYKDTCNRLSSMNSLRDFFPLDKVTDKKQELLRVYLFVRLLELNRITKCY